MPQLGEHDLPEHVRLVMAALAKALGDQSLTPERLASAREEIERSYACHRVSIAHVPRSAKGTKPRLKAKYVLQIAGPKIDGSWSFSSEELTDLLAKLRTD